MFKRRQFLTLGIAGVAGLTGIAAWRFAHGDQENIIVEVVRKRLDYLTLDDQGLRDFARDLVSREILSSTKLRFLDAIGPVYTRLPNLSDFGPLDTLYHGEERIVSFYLLSSDFFQNGADVNKVVRYREYYDPMENPVPCSNPFARPVLHG